MNSKTLFKKEILRTLFVIWIAWFIGNLCANSLFYLGLDFKSQLPTDMQNMTYHLGTFVYFLTVSMVGIASSHYYIKKWDFSVCWLPKERTLPFYLSSIIFIAILIGLGIMAVQEGSDTSVREIFSKDFIYLISPFIQLIPSMIAYTLLWYVLFLQGFIRIFENNRKGKIVAIFFTSFIYAIYHFASINEIQSFASMIEEVLITFGISIIIATYVVSNKSLAVAFIGNLILNFFVFSPVETFHSSPANWLYAYIIVGITLLVYYLGWIRNESIYK